MLRTPVQFVSILEDEVLPKTLNWTDPDGLEFKLQFRRLSWGFELFDAESGYYGLYSGGQHRRWEVTLSHLACDGGNKLLGKASISFEDDLGDWFNNLLNHHYEECLKSRNQVAGWFAKK